MPRDGVTPRVTATSDIQSKNISVKLVQHQQSIKFCEIIIKLMYLRILESTKLLPKFKHYTEMITKEDTHVSTQLNKNFPQMEQKFSKLIKFNKINGA